MKNAKEYSDFLKSKGLTVPEIIMAISIKENGVRFTSAIYDFIGKYDAREIDGFGDSCIEILKGHYGKKLEIMKPKTLYNKIYKMQRSIIESPDEQHIIDTVDYYLNCP